MDRLLQDFEAERDTSFAFSRKWISQNKTHTHIHSYRTHRPVKASNSYGFRHAEPVEFSEIQVALAFSDD